MALSDPYVKLRIKTHRNQPTSRSDCTIPEIGVEVKNELGWDLADQPVPHDEFELHVNW